MLLTAPHRRVPGLGGEARPAPRARRTSGSSARQRRSCGRQLSRALPRRPRPHADRPGVRCSRRQRRPWGQTPGDREADLRLQRRSGKAEVRRLDGRGSEGVRRRLLQFRSRVKEFGRHLVRSSRLDDCTASEMLRTLPRKRHCSSLSSRRWTISWCDIVRGAEMAPGSHPSCTIRVNLARLPAIAIPGGDRNPSEHGDVYVTTLPGGTTLQHGHSGGEQHTYNSGGSNTLTWTLRRRQHTYATCDNTYATWTLRGRQHTYATPARSPPATVGNHTRAAPAGDIR